MILVLKNHLLHNYSLKVISLILGFSFWYILSQHNTVVFRFTIPMCFYHTTDEMNFEVPETIDIRLQGKRKDFYTLNLKELAVHVDAKKFNSGKNHLHITEAELFLPSSLKLVNCIPSHVVVTLL